MQKITIIQVLLGCLLLICHTSCQKSEEVTSIKPTNQQILNAVKNLPEYNKYLSINNKIQELMPSVIKGATTQQKTKFNNVRRNYTSTLEFFKGDDFENIQLVADILKPLEDLQAERAQVINLILNKLSLKYKLELNELTLALLKTNSSNARTSQRSCASEAFLAAAQAYEYVWSVTGDSGIAYSIADYVYSDAYRACIDPINGGSHTAIA